MNHPQLRWAEAPSARLTDKFLVAQALHSNSRRRHGPFVAVNCAALPENLLESELFGHERGAFTGAVSRQRGKFELADGGTLFLDEVAELSSSIQAKLLRALETRAIDRIGGAGPLSVSVRFIAATNRDLARDVSDGLFREDLYYRVRVLSVGTPPLRERRQDIPALARHFLVKHADRAGRAVGGIAPDAESILVNYEWPGNVRQLQNVIEQAVVLGSGDTILKEDLPEELLKTPAQSPRRYCEVIGDFKRQLFQSAFKGANGNYREVAHLLGLHPKSVHRHLRNLNLTYLLRQ
jgi:transcriptional regulator with PAS, ATPase and Fis domain